MKNMDLKKAAMDLNLLYRGENGDFSVKSNKNGYLNTIEISVFCGLEPLKPEAASAAFSPAKEIEII